MANEFILEVKSLRKYFQVGHVGWFSAEDKVVRAVDDFDLSLRRGEVIALVGESGCGKSTLALTLMGLEEATAGQVFVEGRDITHADNEERKALRRKIQMIFQDPYESLNPTQTIEEIVAEPLQVHGLAPSSEEKRGRVLRALEDAGLKPAEEYLFRFPHQLSGGQRQRVVIAAAADLRKTRGISVIFITHDLSTVGYFADRVAVMYLGRIVELGGMLDVLKKPQHPYTQALLSVIPVPNPRLRKKRMILQGETPNPLNMPSGCRFHPRCPVALELCKQNDPPLIKVTESHQAACLLLVK